ncbi:MAG: peptidoglycan-binding domain-containing protein [Candidatus Omnitrophica bacterium]|nr:peptidoglycan-binding domain-containing protein [Candidatus Omnitrophota bacterium]
MWGKLLLSILLVFGLAGCATTGTQKTDRCQELQAKVNEMESQLQQKNDELRNLEEQLKVRGEEVKDAEQVAGDEAKPSEKNIQSALKNAGFYSGAIDGKVGRKTREAVEEFQKANGLKADGKVGPQTWSKLKKYLE